MTNRYRPISITEVGLKKFLESKEIDYDEFVARHNLGEPDAVIARALGVKDRRTVAAWRKIHRKERIK